jgi:pyrroline-5-carboxylate reductase
MKNIGFIGLGHMGQALLRAFLKTGIPASRIILSSRTVSKLYEITTEFTDITIAENSADVAAKADLLFICVNTYEVVNVLEEIYRVLTPETHIVSIAGGLNIDTIEQKFKGKISRVIPTLTCEVLKGTSLVCHNNDVDTNDQVYLENLLEKIGNVFTIQEKQFPVYTALSSCAPGLIAAIFNVLLASAVKSDTIDEHKAFKIILSSLDGTSALLKHKKESFSDLVNRVARKGGNTEIGVSLFQNNFPEIFDTMFSKMLINEQNRNLKTAEQFSIQNKPETQNSSSAQR